MKKEKKLLESYKTDDMIGYFDPGPEYKGISLVAGQSHRLFTERAPGFALGLPSIRSQVLMNSQAAFKVYVNRTV